MLPSPFPHEIAFSSFSIAGCPDINELLCRLHPDEQSIAEKMTSASRKVSFAAGRLAAKLALQRLGLSFSSQPVIRGPRGEPIWPELTVGSISHTVDTSRRFHQAVAAVALSKNFQALGVDVEFYSRQIKCSITRHICLAEEQDWVNSNPESAPARLLEIFSAKECIYKAVYQAHAASLGFKQALLVWDEGKSSFTTKIISEQSELSNIQCSPVRVIRTGDALVSGVFISRN